jgi:hypothetical protein
VITIKRHKYIKRHSTVGVVHGEMSSWGMSFRQIGRLPTAVCFTVKDPRESLSYEVEVSEVKDVKNLYLNLRDYLERHGAL